MILSSYYDDLMNSDRLTVRLFTKFDPNKPLVPRPAWLEILRFPMTEMANVNVSHSYKGLTSGLSGIFYAVKNSVDSARISWANRMNEYQKICDAINAFASGLATDKEKKSITDYLASMSKQELIPQTIKVSDYFKAFAGTRVQIPLTFSIKLYTYVDKLTGMIITPDSQIQMISRYFVGDTKKVEYFGGDSKSLRIAAYTAPNGFQEFGSFSGVMTQEGFAMRFGTTFDIGRLLITNFSFSPSREIQLINGIKTKLYYNVSFTMMPIYAITVLDLIRMFGANSAGANLDNMTSVRAFSSGEY